MKRHECDCGRVFYNLDALARCVDSDHGRAPLVAPSSALAEIHQEACSILASRLNPKQQLSRLRQLYDSPRTAEALRQAGSV